MLLDRQVAVSGRDLPSIFCFVSVFQVVNFCSVIKIRTFFFLLCSSVVDERKEVVFPVLRILLQHICAKVCQALLHLELKNLCVDTSQYV